MTEIKLVQIPIITHDLVNIGRSVTDRLDSLNIEGQIVTDETIQTLKKLRADLNKESKEWSEQIKAVDEIATKPIKEFKDTAKTEVIEKYKAADEILKNKIGDFESKLKEAKRLEVTTYFSELCLAENLQWLTFERLGIEVKLSDSLKSLKGKCFEFVSKTVDEINLIKTNEYEAEIMVEYRKSMNAAKSIREVQDRKQAEKLEQDRIKLQETQRRQSMLGKLAMTYRDMTQSYNYVSDEAIFMLNSDIENVSKDEFNKRYVELESRIEQHKKSIVSEPIIPKIGDLQKQFTSPITQQSTSTEVIQAVFEPLQAPVIEQPKAQIVPARFECFGTMAQLTALGQYMKQNNITYKNL